MLQQRGGANSRRACLGLCRHILRKQRAQDHSHRYKQGEDALFAIVALRLLPYVLVAHVVIPAPAAPAVAAGPWVRVLVSPGRLGLLAGTACSVLLSCCLMSWLRSWATGSYAEALSVQPATLRGLARSPACSLNTHSERQVTTNGRVCVTSTRTSLTKRRHGQQPSRLAQWKCRACQTLAAAGHQAACGHTRRRRCGARPCSPLHSSNRGPRRARRSRTGRGRRARGMACMRGCRAQAGRAGARESACDGGRCARPALRQGCACGCASGYASGSPSVARATSTHLVPVDSLCARLGALATPLRSEVADAKIGFKQL